MKRFFNEKSLLGKVESLFWFCYNKEPLRFIFWGAINTFITLINTIILNFIFSEIDWSSKLLGRTIDIPFIIAFIIGIPISYTTHTLFTFKVKWNFLRLLRYPLSSIPNFLLQSLCIYIFGEVLSLNINLAYIISSILPLPIMFLINKFLVEPINIRGESNKKKKEENTSTN